MRRRSFRTLVLVLLVSLLGAPRASRATVAWGGLVVDAATGQPIRGAEAVVSGLTARTGEDGRFALIAEDGEADLSVRATGYRPRSVSHARRAPDLVIELAPLPVFGGEVVVTEDLPEEEAPATRAVAPELVMNVAGSLDNIFRTLQVMPGVSAAEDFSSRLSVRGGGPDQNLTVMDGIEIHNPYRLYGLISAFNPETVEDFRLTAGGFDARHGDRLSSLLTVDNRRGSASGLSGTSSLSLTDGNVVVEGGLPGADTGSWLLSARRTYYDLVAERFLSDDLPSFTDIQGSATLNVANGHRLQVQGLRSREGADLEFEGDVPGEQGALLAGARNDLLALRHDGVIGTRAVARTILSWYRFEDSLGFDGRVQAETRRSNAPDDVARFSDVVFDRRLAVRDLALRHELSLQISPHSLVEAGGEVHRLDTRVAWDIRGDRNPNEANGSSVRGGAGLPDRLDSRLEADRAGGWLQHVLSAGNGLRLATGVRFDWSSVNDRFDVAPRLSASLPLDGRTRLSMAFGLYTQSPGYEKLIQADYFLDLDRAASLDSERSWHTLVSAERDLGAGVSLRLEAWHKRFDQLIVGRLETAAELAERRSRYDFPEQYAASVPRSPGILSDPINDGRGHALGADLYLVRRPTSSRQRLSGWISYTWSRAEQTAWGVTAPVDYDRRHALNIVGNCRLSGKLDVGLTARIASGFPYTAPQGLRVAAIGDLGDRDGDGNRTELVPELDAGGLPVYEIDLGAAEDLNRSRLPLYARVDARVTWHPGGRDGRWSLYLEALNVLDRDNAGTLEPSLEHNPGSDRPRIVETAGQSVPFLPSFGVRLRF